MLHEIIAIESELSRLDVTQSTLSALTCIPAGSLSDIIRGVKKPGFEQERDIYRWLEGLKRLIEAAKPLQLDLKKTLQLKQQIELLESGRLQIIIAVQEERQEKATAYSIQLKSGSWLARVDDVFGRKEVIATFNLLRGAASFTKEAGEQAILALENLGWAGSKLVQNKYAGEDSIIFDIKTAGL